MSVQDDLRKILGLKERFRVPPLPVTEPIAAALGRVAHEAAPAPEPKSCVSATDLNAPLALGQVVRLIDGVKDARSSRQLRVFLDETALACEAEAPKSDRWFYALKEAAQFDVLIQSPVSVSEADGVGGSGPNIALQGIGPEDVRWQLQSSHILLPEPQLLEGETEGELKDDLYRLIHACHSDYAKDHYWMNYASHAAPPRYRPPNLKMTKQLEQTYGLPPSTGQGFVYEYGPIEPGVTEWGLIAGHPKPGGTDMQWELVHHAIGAASGYPLVTGYITKGGAGLNAMPVSIGIWQVTDAQTETLIQTVPQDAVQYVYLFAIVRDDNTLTATLRAATWRFEVTHPLDAMWVPAHLKDDVSALSLQDGIKIRLNEAGYEIEVPNRGERVYLNAAFEVVAFQPLGGA